MDLWREADISDNDHHRDIKPSLPGQGHFTDEGWEEVSRTSGRLPPCVSLMSSKAQTTVCLCVPPVIRSRCNAEYQEITKRKYSIHYIQI